eukprot:9467170-Pyramimonas_sp.AAC.2
MPIIPPLLLSKAICHLLVRLSPDGCGTARGKYIELSELELEAASPPPLSALAPLSPIRLWLCISPN